MSKSLYLRYFPKSGIDVNGNFGSNCCVADMFAEWVDFGAQELTLVVNGVSYQFERKKSELKEKEQVCGGNCGNFCRCNT